MKTILAAFVFSTLLAWSSVGMARDIVHDPEFVRMEKEFGKQWRADDKQVREKLAALEKKFGKKPNIVYILADDVGFTELGSYGGGKLRGAPTPSLDKMARQGMRFLNFYSEVECSPSRGAVTTGPVSYTHLTLPTKRIV